jgi:ferredoxin
MMIMIDEDKCLGCGMCSSLCPEVFTIGYDGTVYPVVEMVEAGIAGICYQSAELCPTDAITISD